jgi:hypothetical protein
MRTTSTNDQATVESEPEVQFLVHQDENGSVAATVAVSWTLNRAAIEFVTRERENHPRLLVIVASATQRIERYGNYPYIDYDTTSVYSVPLLNSKGEPTPPKLYVSFAKPGQNIIVGAVFTSSRPEAVKRWKREPDDVAVYTEGDQLLIRTPYNSDVRFANRYASSHTIVEVPREMFAPEPAKWQKKLVQHYAGGRKVDQCDFRKWFLISLALLVVVQLYGLVLRPLVLVIAVIAGCRGMFDRSFFALNPHDYVRQLRTSYWVEDKNGEDRPLVLVILSPPGLLVSAYLLYMSVLPGLVAVGSWNMAHGNGDALPNLWISWALGWAFWLCVGLVWVGVTVVYVQRMVKNRVIPRKGFRNPIAEPIWGWLQERASNEDSSYENPAQHTLQRLEAAQAAILEPQDMPDTTVRLKFAAFKTKVCKPFAR